MTASESNADVRFTNVNVVESVDTYRYRCLRPVSNLLYAMHALRNADKCNTCKDGIGSVLACFFITTKD